MRIEGLELKNIGVFEDVKMEFPKCPDGQAEIHIFTGVNGSGKSTILKALACGFEYVNDFSRIDENLNISEDVNNFKSYAWHDTKPISTEYPIGNSKGKILLRNDSPIEFVILPGLGIDVKSDSQDVAFHRFCITPKFEEAVAVNCAIFSYSAYRNIGDNNGRTQDSKNPLYQAVKFIKKRDKYHSIEEWIKKSLYKKSYSKIHGGEKNVSYGATLAKLEKVIGSIIGFEVRFGLDSILENPVMIYAGRSFSLDSIPDGIKSLISWLADLCIRLDRIPWADDVPVFNRNLILFLDEIENHLHIKWQRKVLPIVQKLLPNAQIFVTTHSPFVVNSIDDAWVHRLQLDEATKTATIAPPQGTSTGNSYVTELMKTFEVYEEYGIPVSEKLQQFHQMKNHILEGKNGNTKEFLTLAKDLANVSPSLNNDIQIQLRKLSRQTSKEFSIV